MKVITILGQNFGTVNWGPYGTVAGFTSLVSDVLFSNASGNPLNNTTNCGQANYLEYGSSQSGNVYYTYPAVFLPTGPYAGYWELTGIEVPVGYNPGFVNVQVQTTPSGDWNPYPKDFDPGNWSPVTPNDQYEYCAPPVVTTVAPGAGPIAGDGEIVAIDGDNLALASAVSFGTYPGEYPATFTDIFMLDVPAPGQPVPYPIPPGFGHWEVFATLPADTEANLVSGTVNVYVTTPGGTADDKAAFTYLSPPVFDSMLLLEPGQTGNPVASPPWGIMARRPAAPR